jgi:hypothetical protein
MASRELAQKDPALFLKSYPAPLIIDEIQYAPNLLSEIKILIDSSRRKYGQYVLTGSQVFQLMKGVSESLAGRIAIFQLFPLSWGELPKKNVHDAAEVAKILYRGFFPEFEVTADLNPKLWFSSYIASYLERDIRSIRMIQDLMPFQKFMTLLAARAGQLFNLLEISKEVGISQTTAKDWLTLLQTTGIIHLLPPYSRNITKQVIKSPKLYFIDTGLLCALLRLDKAEDFYLSPFSGHIFENMVVMEVIKQFAGKGERAPCYFFRSKTGVEVDLIVEKGSVLEAYEIKCSLSPSKEMAAGLIDFAKEAKVSSRPRLLSLFPDTLHFSHQVEACHWSSIFGIY